MGLLHEKRIIRLEAEIFRDERKVECHMKRIREYVATHSTEDILKNLPSELHIISDSAAELKKMKLRLRLLKIFRIPPL